MHASIWFNKQCQTYLVTPKYAQSHLKDKNTCNIKTNMFRDIPIDGNETHKYYFMLDKRAILHQ
jgi:hypothetical protein